MLPPARRWKTSQSRVKPACVCVCPLISVKHHITICDMSDQQRPLEKWRRPIKAEKAIKVVLIAVPCPGSSVPVGWAPRRHPAGLPRLRTKATTSCRAESGLFLWCLRENKKNYFIAKQCKSLLRWKPRGASPRFTNADDFLDSTSFWVHIHR